MFIDTHAHLHVKNFDSDRAQAVERALKAKVSKIINVGFDVEENFRAIALANEYEFIYASVGIHPHLASQWNDSVGAKILEQARNNHKIVALGEMGLDYHKNFQPREIQQNCFRAQLRLAREINLSVIVHCRDAVSEALAILDQEQIRQAVFHCFTGASAEADLVLAHGFYLGFTGVVTYKNASGLREILKKCPLEKILLETDCPYLSPRKFRGMRNESVYVVEVYKEAARLRSMPLEELADQIASNARFFFHI